MAGYKINLPFKTETFYKLLQKKLKYVILKKPKTIGADA